MSWKSKPKARKRPKSSRAATAARRVAPRRSALHNAPAKLATPPLLRPTPDKTCQEPPYEEAPFEAVIEVHRIPVSSAVCRSGMGIRPDLQDALSTGHPTDVTAPGANRRSTWTSIASQVDSPD
jgi:hypothetical protein